MERVYSVSSQKIPQRWPVPCIAPENARVPLPHNIFIRVRSEQEWNIAAISGLMLFNPRYPASTEFKSAYAAVCVTNYSSLRNHYRTGEKSPGFHYDIDITMADVRSSYIL